MGMSHCTYIISVLLCKVCVSIGIENIWRKLKYTSRTMLQNQKGGLPFYPIVPLFQFVALLSTSFYFAFLLPVSSCASRDCSYYTPLLVSLLTDEECCSTAEMSD